MANKCSVSKTKKRQIIILVLLLIIIILAGVYYIFTTAGLFGQGPYGARDLSKYINLPDYEGIKTELKASSAEENDGQATDEETTNSLKQEAWNMLQQGSEVIKYPSSRVRKYYRQDMKYYESLAEAYGYTDFDLYITEKHGSTEEEFEEYVTQYAQTQVANELLVYALAGEIGLEVTDQEYEEYLARALEEADYTRETFEEFYGMTIEKYGDENHLRLNLLQQKIMDYMVA